MSTSSASISQAAISNVRCKIETLRVNDDPSARHTFGADLLGINQYVRELPLDFLVKFSREDLAVIKL